MAADHNNDWTVSTLKQYFDTLRKEDEKAIVLLRTDMTIRLDRISESFEELKTSVEQFHASYRGGESASSIVFFRTANVLAIIIAAGALIVSLFHR